MKRLFIISTIIAVIIGAIAFIPSPWLFKQVEPSLNDVSVGKLSGHLWRGSARDIEVVRRGYVIDIDNVRWNINWPSLFSFSPCFYFTAESDTINGNGQLCFNPFLQYAELRGVQTDIEASEVAQLTGAEIKGKLKGEIFSLTIKNQKVYDVDADVVWQFANVHNGEQWIDIGDVLIALSAEPGKDIISANWFHMESMSVISPIDINLEMIFIAEQLSSIQGTVEPRSLANRSLVDSLELLSQSREGNTFFIDYQD